MISHGNRMPVARPTVRTVADAAGVSTATVSRVMSGVATVDPALAERVRQVANELGYRPSGAARGLALGSQRSLGVVMPDLANAHFHYIVKQMHSGASEHGYRILIADHSGDPEDELATARDLLGYVDGLVLLSSRIRVEGLRWLARQSRPVVLVNRLAPGVDLPMIVVDSFHAMLELCSHLVQLGHRRAAYVGGSALAWQNLERWRAIEASGAFGLAATQMNSDGTVNAGYAATEWALDQEATAIVCFNDLTAFGVLSRLRELGVDVPGDVSVTGFDDLDLARHFPPGLTTVRIPRGPLGDAAWDRVHALLAGEPADPEPTLLHAEVIVRGSTGPARSN